MIININSNSLRYGLCIGYELSRLEWLWSNNSNLLQESFVLGKKELLLRLPTDISVSEENYESFSQSILGYYFRTDINVYSAVLIGICVQRCMLIEASNSKIIKNKLIDLAKSALVSIPKKIVSKKDIVFDLIMDNKAKGFYEIIDIIEELNQKENVDLDNKKESKKPTLFLSYCKKDESVANIIENKLMQITNNGIIISRYTRVPYKESFKGFMNSIQDHDYVLCIVSDSYLKSQACMYEVGEIIKDHHFENKLFFVVLQECDAKYYSTSKDCLVAANIYGNEQNRLDYIKYWKNKYDNLRKLIIEIEDEEAIMRSLNQLKEIGRIYRNDISEFTAYLADSNGKSFEELESNNFKDIIRWIYPNWESRLFVDCKSFSELLKEAIVEISKITLTDYNQIALSTSINSHETGLMVFADNVAEHKQRYRLVVMNGIMAKSFSTGILFNIDNVETEPSYFYAVGETKSELVIPIQQQGNIIGVINSESEEHEYYTDIIVKKLMNLAEDLSIALYQLGYISNIPKDLLPYIHI